MSLLLDVSDDRRANKPWLPNNANDVSEGRVVKGPLHMDGKPLCVLHGAMNRIHPHEPIWRCSEFKCGVGAIYYPTNSKEAKIAFRKAWDARVVNG